MNEKQKNFVIVCCVMTSTASTRVCCHSTAAQGTRQIPFQTVAAQIIEQVTRAFDECSKAQKQQSSYNRISQTFVHTKQRMGEGSGTTRRRWHDGDDYYGPFATRKSLVLTFNIWPQIRETQTGAGRWSEMGTRERCERRVACSGTYRYSLNLAHHVGRQEGDLLSPLDHEQQVMVCIVVHVCCRLHRP